MLACFTSLSSSQNEAQSEPTEPSYKRPYHVNPVCRCPNHPIAISFEPGKPVARLTATDGSISFLENSCTYMGLKTGLRARSGDLEDEDYVAGWNTYGQVRASRPEYIEEMKNIAMIEGGTFSSDGMFIANKETPIYLDKDTCWTGELGDEIHGLVDLVPSLTKVNEGASTIRNTIDAGSDTVYSTPSSSHDDTAAPTTRDSTYHATMIDRVTDSIYAGAGSALSRLVPGMSAI